MSHPTLTLRALLNDSYLYASASNGVVEAWPCSPVPKIGFEVQPQQKSCTREIPVTFSHRNTSYSGYLEPTTLVISHFGTPADCAHRRYQPLHIFNHVYVYNREAGTLKRASNVHQLDLLSFKSDDDFDQILPIQIFRPVMLYSWQGMSPNSSLSALWHTLHAQSQVYKFLGSEFVSTGTETTQENAKDLAQNLVKQAFGSLGFLLADPFHLWIALSCAVVNILFVKTLIRLIRSNLLPRLRSSPIVVLVGGQGPGQHLN